MILYFPWFVYTEKIYLIMPLRSPCAIHRYLSINMNGRNAAVDSRKTHHVQGNSWANNIQSEIGMLRCKNNVGCCDNPVLYVQTFTLGFYPNGGKEKEPSCLSFFFHFNLRWPLLFFMEGAPGNNTTYAS